jgi:5-methyltetrahydrofolate--homocysteine methyltransferase
MFKGANMTISHIEQIYEAVLTGDADVAVENVEQALKHGVAANEILNQGLIDAMREVGRRFEVGDYFVPEMLIAARAMKASLELLRPYLVEQGVEPIGKLAIGTVKGDLHDIGKSLVAMMCEGEGFEIIDLGVNVSPQTFVETAKSGVQIIGMSALLTTTMPAMKTSIEAIKEAGLRDKVKIMIGGAPVTQEYADKIEADGYAGDAATAARIARVLLEE